MSYTWFVQYDVTQCQTILLLLPKGLFIHCTVKNASYYTESPGSMARPVMKYVTSLPVPQLYGIREIESFLLKKATHRRDKMTQKNGS